MDTCDGWWDPGAMRLTGWRVRDVIILVAAFGLLSAAMSEWRYLVWIPVLLLCGRWPLSRAEALNDDLEARRIHEARRVAEENGE